MKYRIAIAIIMAALLLIGFKFYQPADETKATEEFAEINDMPEPEVTEESIEEQSEEPEEAVQAEKTEAVIYERTYNAPQSTTGAEFMFNGIARNDEFYCTWYSSNDLYHYRTSEWTADENGIYRDSDGYVVVAAKLKNSPDDTGYNMGDVIENTPFGAARVYDTGNLGDGHLDIYTNF